LISVLLEMTFRCLST